MAQTPDHPTTVSSGTLIMGTYEIERLINSGGMGEVYRGRNIHNGEPVAIKIVLPSLAHDPKIVALFQKESTVLSRLSHEAIVRYHVFTVDPTIGRPCMVMEFVSGTAMSDRIDQGPMPVEDVKVMLRRVASGLDKAHRAGVVHRDLSPDNVILEEGKVEHAKLIDFGIAKSTALGAGTLLQGQFAGKFNWVSPEQLGAYGGVVDGRSDIYSLGLITAAASRGSVLQMGASIVDAVGSRSKVPDLTGVDAGLVPLLSWMLNPDPAQRPESMAQVMAAVDNPNLVPEVQPEQPAKIDPNRTVIGGALPIPEPITPAVSVAPVAPQVSVVPQVSVAPVAAAVTAPPLAATVIAPVTAAPAPAAEPEDASPFGAPGAKAAAVMASVAAPEPVRKGKGGMVAVLALLALGGGGAGAYYAGMFDQKATPVAGETQEQADARVKADQAAADKKAADEAAKQAEAQKAAEAGAAKKAEVEKAAKQAEADAAAKKAAEDEAARKQAEADAEAKKLAEAEAAKKAEADAAAKKLADEAAAKKAEEEALKAAAAAKQAEADAAAKKAAEDAAKKAEADAAALKAAEAAKQAEAEAAAKKAADEAAKQAEAEAAAKKAAEEAAKQAEAEAAAKKAADEAAAKKAEEEAAAKKLAEDEAARKAAAEAAAKADPVAAQLVYLTDYRAPLCSTVRIKEPKQTGFVLDGFTADPAALAGLADGWKTATNTTPKVLTHQVNISQCAVLDFANNYPAPDIDTLAISSNAGEVVKSGSNVEGKVVGLNGRNLTFLLFSEGGGATNLKPWTSVNSDGSVSFAFNLTLEAGQPSAPQILVALATDQPLTSMDKLRDGTAAQALMPFLEKQLSMQGIKPTLGFGFFRLEN